MHRARLQQFALLRILQLHKTVDSKEFGITIRNASGRLVFTCQAEVAEQNVQIGGDTANSDSGARIAHKHIARLHIAMNDIHRMNVRKCGQQLLNDTLVGRW